MLTGLIYNKPSQENALVIVQSIVKQMQKERTETVQRYQNIMHCNPLNPLFKGDILK